MKEVKYDQVHIGEKIYELDYETFMSLQLTKKNENIRVSKLTPTRRGGLVRLKGFTGETVMSLRLTKENENPPVPL